MAPTPMRVTHLDRCPDEDADGGRCQLLAGHLRGHAAAVDGAFLTWEAGAVYRWASSRPPVWLVMLGWAPGFQPEIVPDDSSPPIFADE